MFASTGRPRGPSREHTSDQMNDIFREGTSLRTDAQEGPSWLIMLVTASTPKLIRVWRGFRARSGAGNGQPRGAGVCSSWSQISSSSTVPSCGDHPPHPQTASGRARLPTRTAGTRASPGQGQCPGARRVPHVRHLPASYSDKRLHAKSYFSKPNFHKSCTSRATTSEVTRLASGPTGWNSTPSARSPWECTFPW